MISKRDSKPFKIKFPIGISKTNKIDTKYQDNWEDVSGLIGDPSGYIAKNMFGSDPDIDKTVIVNAGNSTRSIDYNTCILLDNMPTRVYENGDYSVVRKMPEYNGEIVLGLQKKQSIDIPKLYFIYNGEVLYYQLNFDKDTLKGYIGINDRLPFAKNDYVWTREPVDNTVTKHRLKFVSSKRVGLGGPFKPFIELTFVEE